jgi:hypothetical protein
MSLETEVQELTAQIKLMLGRGGPNVGTCAQIFGGVSTAVNSVTDSMAKLTFGTYNLQTGLGDFTKIVSAVGGNIGKGFGDMLAKIGNEAIYLNTALNDAGKSGVNFDNNLGPVGSKKLSP